MIQIFLIFFTLIVTSLYFFPVSVGANVNSKMVIAGLGLIVFIVQLAQKKKSIEKDYVLLSLSAFLVTLIGVVSMWYNGTADTAYATYIVSMFVWLGGAYLVVELIKSIHGHISVLLLCNYLVSVCVLQCVLALAIDMNSTVKSLVDSIYSDGAYYTEHDRLYGFGASLDVAGTRFSAVLIMISCICVVNIRNLSHKWLAYYSVSFVIIATIGNMISRTTTVGVILSLVYFLYVQFLPSDKLDKIYKHGIIKWLSAIIVISLPIIIYYYQHNPTIHENIRFAFEGFFSLIETGKWEVHSNNMLENMYFFPDSIKTWIIGDGYFANPLTTDPYYTGNMMTAFYMGTDVGYLRFILYFGVLGLVAFMSFFFFARNLCTQRHPEFRHMFILLLLTNFIVWFKVATDIFLVFALCLCIPETRKTED